MEKKKLPMGIERFEEVIREEFYYIDKTGLIGELLHDWSKVNLFTRPRRFGKSLNMSMFRNFFEIGCDARLFDGLAISKKKDLCEKYMGKFPVISISLKDVESDSFAGARKSICNIVAREAKRFEFLSQSKKLSELDKEQYRNILALLPTLNWKESDMLNAVLEDSLRNLSELLKKHYEKDVIILIDEYDVPLAKANQAGYYDQMVLLIRKMFGAALKTNDALYFAILTGCLRVAKESIFTGLNNFSVMSVADVNFDEFFGFTDSEVKELLAYYELSDCYETIKEWYDGYRFGNVDVYCPWDVINYCYALRADRNAFPQNYWINTSSNDIVKEFIQKVDKGTAKREIEKLIAGETIVKEIHQELTYKDMYDSIENMWSVLFTTGYLTLREKIDGTHFRLAIPNQEVRNIFVTQIMSLFKEKVRRDGETLNAFCDALRNGETEKVETYFGDYLKKTISIRDTFVRKSKKENFYHGILLGILGVKEEWDVSSNKESGDGYSDIFVETDDEIGIIIEVKYAENAEKLQEECEKALKQIQGTEYEAELRDDGIEKILKYGIACYKKRCRVLKEE